MAENKPNGGLSRILQTWISGLNLVEKSDEPFVGPKHFLSLLSRLENPRVIPEEETSAALAGAVAEWLHALCGNGFQLDREALIHPEWNPGKAKTALAALYAYLYVKRKESPVLRPLVTLPREEQLVVEDALKLLNVTKDLLTDELLAKALGHIELPVEQQNQQQGACRRLPLGNPSKGGTKRRSPDESFEVPSSRPSQSRTPPLSIASAQKQHESAVDRLHKELRQARSDNDELMRQLENVESSRSQAESRIKSLETSLRNIRSEKDILESLMRQRDSEVEHERTDSERLDHALTQLRKTKDELKIERSARSSEEAKNAELSDKVEKLELKLRKFYEDRNELLRKLEETQNRIETFERNEYQLARENKSLQAEVQRLSADFDVAYASVSSEFDETRQHKKLRRSDEVECSPGVSSRRHSSGARSSFGIGTMSPARGEDLTCVLEARIGDAKRETEAVKEQLVQVTKEKDDFIAKLDLQVKSNAEKAKFIEDLSKERKTLEATLTREREAQKTTVAVLEAHLAKANVEKNDLESKLQDARELQAELEDRIREMSENHERALGGKQTELNGCKTKLTIAEANLKQLKENYTNKTEEEAQVRQELTRVNEYVAQLDQSRSDLQNRLDGLFEELQNKSRALDGAVEDRNRVESDLAKKLEEEKALRKQLKESSDVVGTLQGRVAGLEKTVKDLEQLLGERLTELEKTNCELVALRSNLVAETEARKGTEDHLRQTVQQLEQREKNLGELRKSAEQLSQALSETQLKLKQQQDLTQAKVADLDATSAALKQEKQAREEEQGVASSKIADCFEKIQNLTSERASFESLSQKLEEDIANLNCKLKNSKETLASLRAAFEEQTSVLEATSAELAEKKSKIEDLNQEKVALQSTIEEQKHASEVDAQKLAAIETRLVETEHAHKKLYTDLEQANQELEVVRRQKVEEQEKAAKEMLKLESSKDTLQSSVEQLKKQLADAKITIDQSSDEITQLTEATQMLGTVIGDKISELAAEKQKGKEKEEAFEAAAKEHAEKLETLRKSLEKAEEDKRQLESSLEDVNKQLAEEKVSRMEADSSSAELLSNKAAEMEKLQEEKKALQLSIITTEESLAEMEGQLKAVQEVLVANDKDREVLMSKTHELSEQLDKAKKAHEEVLVINQQEIDVLDTKLENMKITVAGFEEQLLGTQEKLKKIEEDAQGLQMSLTEQEAALTEEKRLRKEERQAAEKKLVAKAEELKKLEEIRVSLKAGQECLQESLDNNKRCLESLEKSLEESEQERQKVLQDYQATTEQLSAVENQLAEEKKANKGLNEKVEKILVARGFVESRVKELEESVEGLSLQLSQERGAKEMREQELQKELDVLTSALNLQREERDDLAKALDEVRQQVEKLEAEKEEQIKEMEAKTAELTAAKLLFDEERMKLLESHAEVSAKLEAADEVNKEALADFGQAKAEWGKEKMLLQEKSDELAEKIQKLAEQNEVLVAKVKEAEDQLENLKVKSSGELTSLRSHMEEQNLRKEEEVKSLLEQVDERMKEMENLVTANARKEQALMEVTGKLEELQNDKDIIVVKLEAAKKESACLEATLQATQGEKQKAEETLEEVQSKMEALQKDLLVVETEKSAALKEASCKLEKVEKLNEVTIQKLAAAQEAASQLEAALQSAKEEKLRTEAALQDSVSKVNTIGAELASADKKCSELQNMLDAKESNLCSTENELKTKKEEYEALEKTLMELRKEMEEQKAANGEDKKMLAAINEVLLDFAKKYNMALRPEKLNQPDLPMYFFGKMNHLMTSIQGSLLENDQLNVQLKADKKKLQKELADLQAASKKREEEILSKATKEAERKVKLAMEGSQAEMNSLRAKYEASKDKLHDMAAEIERQRDQIRQLDRDKAMYERSAAEKAERFKSQLVSRTAALEAKLKQKEQEVTSLNAQLQFADVRLREAEKNKTAPKLRTMPSSDHIYETISENDLFPRPSTSGLSRSRRDSVTSGHSYASLRHNLGTSSSSLKSRVSNASSLTLPCADELGEVLSTTGIAESTKFGHGRAIIESLGTSSREIEEDVDGRAAELKWRNSLVPMHLRSVYPSEMSVAAKVSEQELKRPNVTAMAIDALDRMTANSHHHKSSRGRRSRSLTPPPRASMPACMGFGAGRLPFGRVDPNSPSKTPASPRGVKTKFGERDQSFAESFMDASSTSVASFYSAHDNSSAAVKRSRLQQAIPGRAKPTTPKNFDHRLSLAPGNSKKKSTGARLHASMLANTPASIKKLLRSSTRRLSRAASTDTVGRENDSLLEHNDDPYSSISDDGSPASRTRSKLNTSNAKAQVFRNPFRAH